MQAEPLNIEDPAALERYLVAEGRCAAGEVVEHEALAGGVSSRTVRVALADGRRWVLKQALAKLRTAADWFSDPRRVHREALGMQTLNELTGDGSIPALVFDDERWHVLAMQAVPRPHQNWKALLLAGQIDPDHMRQFAVLLATIHRASARRHETLAQRFADRTFFETLRVEPYYQYSALQAPAAAEFYRRLIDDTRATRTALVHGDYSPKNVLVHAARLVLIDHEVIHWGDPAFDVGFALTHLLSKAHHLPAQRATLAAAANAWWEAYREAASEPAPGEIVPPGVASGGLPICAERCARHALGCLLARVAGRSPLEYLTAPERDRQRRAVLRLIERVPGDVPELIDRFIHEIAR